MLTRAEASSTWITAPPPASVTTDSSAMTASTRPGIIDARALARQV